MPIHMPVKLHRDQKLTLTDQVTCHQLYGYRTPDNLMTVDVVIEIDHAGLIELVRKAATNKSLRTKDGPVVVKLSNLVKPGGH